MLKTRLIRSIFFAALVAVTIFPLYNMVVEYPLFTRLLMGYAVDEANRIANHVASSAVAPDRDLSTDSIEEEFLKIVETTKDDFGLVKMKIFAPSGLILFSTEPREIGTVNREAYFHQKVAKGENYAKVIKKESMTLEGQRMNRDVVEAYVPLMNGTRFRGAFEIYLDITDERQGLNVLLGRSYFLISLISLVLMGTVIASSLRADRSIRERARAEQEVLRVNADLSILFEISSSIGKTLDVDDLLASVLKTMTRQEFLRFEQKGSIFIVQDNILHLRSHLGQSEESLAGQKELKLGEGLCGQAALTGDVIVSGNAAKDPRHTLTENDAPSEAQVIIPLKGASAVVGVLCLYLPADAVIDERHVRLFGAVGSEIGRAIENASLFAETRELSLRDPLTGLANRRLLDIMLDNLMGIARRYGTPLSVLIADIDYFKQYNDRFGHTAGDKLLISLAGIVRETLRESDLAVRYGGEEFLLLLPDTGCEKAVEVAERMRETILSKAGVAISFGVTCFHSDGESKGALIARADEALYRSKQEGRNRVTLSL